MYWPLGAPRSYVQQLPLELSSSDPDDRPITLVETPRASVDETQTGRDEATIARHRTGGPDAAHPREADGGTVLCLRASRHGHVFATITSSSLTVWQTQVG